MPFSKTSLSELFVSMRNRVPILVDASSGPITGTVRMIEAEDGSGTCWNVRVKTDEGTKTVFVRTT